MRADTAWREQRLHERHGTGKLLFGRVYEDSAIERAAFAPDAPVFCIASAGCTALDLARDRSVVACDINPAQVEYVARRLEGGPPEVGAAERVMAFARSLAPLAGWAKRRLDAFLDLDDPEMQREYWREHLDTWRLRQGLDVMLSRVCLRAGYSTALLACLPPRFGRVVRQRMERCFFLHGNRSNPYARGLLLGDAAPAPPPGTVRHPLELVVDDAASYLERCAPGSFAGFSLSNILDGAGDDYCTRLHDAIRRAAAPGAVVVSRSFSEPPPGMEHNRAADDRSMLWGIVEVQKLAV